MFLVSSFGDTFDLVQNNARLVGAIDSRNSHTMEQFIKRKREDLGFAQKMPTHAHYVSVIHTFLFYNN